MCVVSTHGCPVVQSLLLASVLAVACLCTGGRSSQAQTLPPDSPALPADPTAPPSSTDPAASSLPTDPTAPATTGPPTAPTNPLIPSQPPPTANPFSAPTLSPTPFSGAAAQPSNPFSLTPSANPSAPLPDATTTNNIGTARRFQYNFALTLGTTYDDNIFLESASRKRSDVYFTLQPTVTLGFGGGGGDGLGNVVRFTYSPQVLLYAARTELDAVQQFVTLSGVYRLPRITLTGSLGVQILDSTDVGNPQASATPGQSILPVSTSPVSSINLDTSQRTRANLYSVALDANYFVSDKVSYDVAGQFSETDYQSEELVSSSALSGSFFFNYTPTGKTTVGVGVTGGYVPADTPTPNQSFEQSNLRFSFSPSPKLLATGQVGLEVRQSSGKSGSDLSPVFELDASYFPFDGSAISLTGNRQVQASAVLGGQDYTLTGFSVSFSQRFLQRVFLRLTTGYSHSDYTSETSSASAGRSDNYYFVQPGVDINLRDNLTVGGYYLFRSSTSSELDRNFTDNQIGVRVSFGF